jgi:hypothetical protein
MNLTKILTIVLFAGSAFLIYYLYDGIDSVIVEREVIGKKEEQMQERLLLIREAEILFQEQMGRYTSNWDSLADFIEKGEVPIIQITEKIEQQAYGVEKVTQIRDTLGYIPAKDKIFKKNYTMNAADDGIFQGFKIQVGDQVIKGQDAYVLAVGGQQLRPIFIENGTISSLADVKVGDKVTKGQNLINFWEYQFNPNIDVRKIGEVPYIPGKMIDIYVGKLDKNGLIVDVIEVIDPAPADKSRKESNENKIRKPLRFGSRLDASTAGNWE